MPSPLVKQFEAPVQVTAITAGSVAARYVFGVAAAGAAIDTAYADGRFPAKKSARPCLITNLHASVPLFVKINPAVGVTATATDFDIKIPAGIGTNGTTVDLSQGGQIAVQSLSVWAASLVVAAEIVVRGVTL